MHPISQLIFINLFLFQMWSLTYDVGQVNTQLRRIAQAAEHRQECK